MKRPTITDVARASGVSKTTVSKVMNLPPDRLDVPESTRQRVLQASRELGYRPSWRARAFAKGRTHTIGLVHVAETPMFASELWERMVLRLLDGLHDAGYDGQFVPAKLKTDRWQQMLMDQRLDGCIIFHELLPEVAEALQAAALPTVLLNAVDERFPCVVPDDRASARTLTEYLLGLGHKRIAFVDHAPTARHFSFAERRGGFAEAMAAAGLSDSAVLISAPREAFARQLLETRPRVTAAIAYSDDVAHQLLHGLWRQGVRVPDDLSLVAFNDTRLSRYSTPPLTVIDVPAEELGRRAAALLVERIDAADAGRPDGLPATPIVIPERLIVRESAAPLSSA